MSAVNAQPKRFLLSLTLARWQRLGAELAAMEHVPHASAIPVEKQLERDRAGEQIAAIVAAVLDEHRGGSDAQVVEISLPLGRATAKYLLTACDRLRRAALHAAWRARGGPAPGPEPSGAIHAPPLTATGTAGNGPGSGPPAPSAQSPSGDDGHDVLAVRPEPTSLAAASSEALSWDRVMRSLSMQHGVVHPLPEMVSPLSLGDSDLAQIGAPVDMLLNGHDLLSH
ncbi:MAG: hypothetical protein U1A78_32355 [Polyangia bacterium]